MGKRLSSQYDHSSGTGGGKPKNSFRDYIRALSVSPAAPATVLLLDGVTDVGNAGAIVRNADFFSASCVVVAKRRTVSADAVLARVSTGSHTAVPLFFGYNIDQAIQFLKTEGYWIFGAVLGKQPMTACDFTADKIALVVGDEHRGISQLVANNCDALFTIMGNPAVDSLNVSVATGIVLHEIARQRKVFS